MSTLNLEHSTQIRVRYHETDGQGRVHHAQYLNYFERGRVELLRHLGHSYRTLEESGLMLVVVEMNIKYHQPAAFDDLLELTTRVTRSKGVRIYHAYELRLICQPDDALPNDALQDAQDTNSAKSPLGVDLLVTADSTIACIDRSGNIRRLPNYLVH